MIGPTGAVRVMVATKPVDFRKGMDGLANLVREAMAANPFDGSIYVFCAKRTDRIKLDPSVYGATLGAARSPMSIPPLVRLTDSQIQLADCVVTEILDALEHGWRVRKEVGPARLTINQQPTFPDLHIEPVDGDVELGCHLRRTEQRRLVVPPGALGCHLQGRIAPEPTNGDGQDLVSARRRAMTLTGEDGSDLVVADAFPGEIEQAFSHLGAACEVGDGVHAHLDLELGHGATAPYDPDAGYVMLTAVEYYLFDQTS
jgi:transposase